MKQPRWIEKCQIRFNSPTDAREWTPQTHSHTADINFPDVLPVGVHHHRCRRRCRRCFFLFLESWFRSLNLSLHIFQRRLNSSHWFQGHNASLSFEEIQSETMRHEMFIYCFYRHVNHLNGSYVMEICLRAKGKACGGSEVEGECSRIDSGAKNIFSKRRYVEKTFWTFNDMWLNVNLSLSIQTGTSCKQHGVVGWTPVPISFSTR